VAHLALKGSAGLYVAGIGGGADTGKSYAQGLSREESAILNQMTREQIGKFQKFGDRVARDKAYRDALSADDREASDLSARLNSATTRATQADAAYRESTRYAQEVSAAHERGDEIRFDLLQDPHNRAMFEKYTRAYGGSPIAAWVMMDAELARQGLPTIHFTDGSAHPNSFRAVRDIHGQDAQDARVNPPIREQHLQNRHAAASGLRSAGVPGPSAGLSGAPHPYAPVAPPPAARQAAPSAADNSPAGSSVLGTVRENVQEAGNRIKGQTRTAEGKLVADHGIVKDPKTGQVYTTQGQLTTAIDAADQDASLGFKNIADNLKGYFKGDTKK
jgi:hypothetical protein